MMLRWRMLCTMTMVWASLVGCGAYAWELADGPLMTRWSKEVSPQNALPEYPRPQMERDQWTNLNGLWQYAIRPASDEQPRDWDGEILVPYPIESALSGVKKPVKPDERLWYRRTFEAPSLERGGRLLLHFGAVDWKCDVWVNGQHVGQHAGGFDPFTFDVTDALKQGNAENEIVVAVSDPTDTGLQARGKQVLEPHGIFYTAVTGIWQTVWLEAVPQRYIESIHIVPNVDERSVAITVHANGDKETDVVVHWTGAHRPGAGPARVMVSHHPGKTGRPIIVELSDNAKLWTPDEPWLHSIEIALESLDEFSGNDVPRGPVDRVKSYFGLRKIEVKKDDKGINRLWLNNEVVFQYGPLDQGWWPDGLYTAPTDEALKYDIEMTKRLGFNMARKHVKVEPARWYYWCDRLGLLVWQDMPSGDFDKTEESQAQYRQELQAMIDALHHFPSIVMWIPFNEGWGQHDTVEVARWTQKYDPSRPVNEASGWHDRGSGDVSDMHNYPGPGMRQPEPDRVVVLGEFGGLGMPVRGHTWQDEKNWGYVSYDNSEALTDAYVELLTAMRPLIARGLAAAVYTQTTDVEIEVNGLLTYDRELIKLDEKRIVEAAGKLYGEPPVVRVLSETSEHEPQTWRYTTTKPADGWQKPAFDDSAWSEAPGGFGDGEVRDAATRTVWNTPNIWLRRTFELQQVPTSGKLMLNVLHDDDAEVYLNGELVRKFERFRKSYRYVLLDDDALAKLREGANTIAVHCRQKGGGQYIDVGLVVVSDR